MTTGVSFKAIKRPATNQTVQFCLEIWKEAFDKAISQGKSEFFAARAGHNAYRDAMPDLTGLAEVQDFIACVGRGILFGAIEQDEAAKLLAAARIASQTFTVVEKALLKAATGPQSSNAA
jgi:small ligand-binding sensory domain FIST